MLGIELHDMPKASCCGAGLMKDYDRELNLALNARILAEAEVMGMDIMTICSTCLMVMSTANHEMKSDPSLLARVNELTRSAGVEYKGTVNVKHLLWVAVEEFGPGRLKDFIKRPLSGLKVAPFYGCHSLRPSKALGFDDPEDPSSMESVIEALGAEAVEYEGRTRCCGFQVDLVSLDTALGMTAKRLFGAKDSGADCIVTPCPFCHINLDSYQGMAEKKADRKINVPILHFAQLLGVALGFGASELGLSRHIVSVRSVMEKLSAV